MKYLIPIVLFFSSCSYFIVKQTKQEIIEEKSERIRDEDKKAILLNSRLFDSLAYYVDTISVIPEYLAGNPIKFKGPLTEKGLYIVGYGRIKFGKQVYSREPQNNTIEVIDSLLFVGIADGGGWPILPETKCNLIWDGIYYTNSDGEICVSLVFSYVNPDLRRAIIRRSLQFDLSPLHHPDVKKIKVNLLGYTYDLYYSY